MMPQYYYYREKVTKLYHLVPINNKPVTFAAAYHPASEQRCRQFTTFKSVWKRITAIQ
jgi:hypothetical protein